MPRSFNALCKGRLMNPQAFVSLQSHTPCLCQYAFKRVHVCRRRFVLQRNAPRPLRKHSDTGQHERRYIVVLFSDSTRRRVPPATPLVSTTHYDASERETMLHRFMKGARVLLRQPALHVFYRRACGATPRV